LALSEQQVMTAGSVLAGFHPAVRTWFERRFPAGPTEAQAAGWPVIMSGRNTLIAAPTGSGKTLAGFLVCIDQLYREFEAGEDVSGAARVVYVSPLKALAVDIEQNLQGPLREIAGVARELGMSPPDLSVAVRTGDTPNSARAAMLRRPPTFVVTTPESLYLLVTAERSRAMLSSVGTVIVDEIHAMARDKRGSHLALTLERLAHVCRGEPVRVGLSATQRPMDVVARLLVGAADGDGPGTDRGCEIVDCGHERTIDVTIEIPDGELEAVASAEQMADVLDRIARHVLGYRTTLVFVNTRRMAERVAHLLAERLGEDAVAAHHGSLSKDRRLRVEARLRAGDLRALVATASLELGIDVGPVDLVCQLGSPRSLATFLQRVGRSGHGRDRVPKGRLFPLTRDELVECSALLAGVRAGRLDRLLPPVAPLDILAQQVVAECAVEEWDEDGLYRLVRRAAPYAGLSRQEYEEVLELVSEGIQTGRGRRAAYVHRDRVNRVLRGRRGARIAALTSGGAIPEVADYRVVADPEETLVGTVNEDWAVESMAGDVFLLGSTSWRIRRVEPGVVRVVDAKGAPPSVPFWLGEAPARTAELSSEVSAIRSEVDRHLSAGDADGARSWLQRGAGIDGATAAQVVSYLAAGRAALGLVPTSKDIVFERFFDETGGMQLVVHCPLGGRINRALGLALRKRFCVSFDFELQAAANDDAIVLSLGPQHSFALPEVARYVSSGRARDVLAQAVLTSPMFTSRWRWNLNRSLAVLRQRGGRRNPPPIQRMEADDLMVAVFPGLAACQENVSGPVEIPDHLLVRQTLVDCLTEAMDVDGLVGLVSGLESGSIRAHFRDTTEPSPLAHEILSGRPYTFLDDAPLEERRTRAVQLRRGLPLEPGDLGQLDADALARVRDEAWPDPRDADELHDVLLSMVVCRPEEAWAPLFDELVAAGRAALLVTAGAGRWFAVERRRWVGALFPGVAIEPDGEVPEAAHLGAPADADEAATEVVRGHLDVSGPVRPDQLEGLTGLSRGQVAAALARLEAEGFALRGRFDPEPAPAEDQWCARRLLARIHAYTQKRLRREIEPVSAGDLVRFLLRWQHVVADTRRHGRRGVLAVVEQLQGFEVPAGSWEEDVLASRVEGYQTAWLDELCLAGEVAWGRLGPRAEPAAARSRRAGATPSRATPVSLVLRSDLPWLLLAARGEAGPLEPEAGAARDILDALRERGALFFSELGQLTGRLPAEVEEGLWDGVARGLVTADGFQSVRSLLSARERWARRQRQRHRDARARLRRGVTGRVQVEGRWSLLPSEAPASDPDDTAEAVAEQLLARWGVVFRDLVARETLALPWREVVWALRRMEARGTVRGGRFVSGFAGEQYALPEAVEGLRRVRRLGTTGETVSLSAADPLNLVGIVTPGTRVPSVRTRSVTYVDGVPLEEPSSTPAGSGS
jgi:ATP-dependent Lhr-like helicase